MSGEELRVSGTEPTPENELSQEPTLLNGSENGQERVWSENVVQLCQTDQVKELQTILKDRHTEHSDFVFYADRLMRLVIEEGLNQLPVTDCTVITPTFCKYEGLEFARGNCGVSLCRSGEAMELALRQCARSIRICKMLIGEEQKVLYARLTHDVDQRRILLLYPILTTGLTVIKAISTLQENGVKERNIFLVALFAVPNSQFSLSRYQTVDSNVYA